jgi:hypothetical protein
LLLDRRDLEVVESRSERVEQPFHLPALVHSVEDVIRPRRPMHCLGSIKVAIIECKGFEVKVLLVLGNIIDCNPLESIGDDEAIFRMLFRLILIVDAAVVSKRQAVRIVINDEAFEELPAREEAIVHRHLTLVHSSESLKLPLLEEPVGQWPVVPENYAETCQISFFGRLTLARGLGR